MVSRFLKLALRMGVPFGVIMGFLFVLLFASRPFFGFSYGLLAFGVVVGAIAGATFGVLAATFAGHRRR